MNINHNIGFNTVFVGDIYGVKNIREFIPKTPIQLASPEFPVDIRMDIEFNEDVLTKQLNLGRGIIFTNKPINLNILQQFKPNIFGVTFVIEKDNDSFDFCQTVQRLGIPITLIT